MDRTRRYGGAKVYYQRGGSDANGLMRGPGVGRGLLDRAFLWADGMEESALDAAHWGA